MMVSVATVLPLATAQLVIHSRSGTQNFRWIESRNTKQLVVRLSAVIWHSAEGWPTVTPHARHGCHGQDVTSISSIRW